MPSAALSIAALLLAQAAAQPTGWFNSGRGWLLFWLLALSSGVLLFIFLARAGWRFGVRRIAGLEAVEEAVGRATEMGRPCLFIAGIQDLDQLETVAGVTVLGRVAQVVADYDSPLIVPTS